MADNLHFYAPIEKTDEEQHMVYGYASTEALDSQGEIVTKDAMTGAIDGYMKFANIREMHQPSAVGKAKKAQIDKKGLYIAAKIVDPLAWEKVKEGVYSGFSIGGRVEKQVGNEITGLKLSEISLVDRPANPEAVIDVFKAEDIEMEKRDFTDEERKTMAENGQALPDGSFPIANEEDLHNAIRAYGRAKNKVAAKKHIMNRAKEMGMTAALPDDWKTKAEEIEMKKSLWSADFLIDLACNLSGYIMGEAYEGEDVESLKSALQTIKQSAISELNEEEDYPELTSAVELAEKALSLKKADEVTEEAVEETEEVKEDEVKEVVEEKPAEEVIEEVKEVTEEKAEKTEMEKVEEGLKVGKMPTNEQIVSLLKAMDEKASERNINVLKWELAGKVLKYLEKSHQDQVNKDAAMKEAEKIQKETPIVTVKERHEFDNVMILVNKLEKQMNEPVEKAMSEQAMNTHTWKEIKVPELAEDPKLAVSQLLGYFQEVVRVITEGNQGTQLTPKQQDEQANGVNEGSDRSAGGHFDDDAVKPAPAKGGEGNGDGDNDADDGIIQPATVKRPMKAEETEDLAKLESELTALKAEVERLSKEPMPMKVFASYTTVDRVEKFEDAEMELEKANKRADELYELMKANPMNQEYVKEAQELAPRLMKLQRATK